MRTLPLITFCLLGGCKPAASPDRKAEAKQEMERLETHREKAVKKATQGTIPEPKGSTFDPTVPPKPQASPGASRHP